MARILVISFSPLLRDPRVTRQVRELSRKHEVTVVGFGVINAHSFRNIELEHIPRSPHEKARDATRILAGKHESVALSNPHVATIRQAVMRSRFDVILANDVDALPVAFEVARGNCPVVLDAHEYAPDEVDAKRFRDRIRGKHKMWLCENYLRRVAGIMTVSQPIAQEYSLQFKIPLPTVVPNAAPFQALTPKVMTPGKIHLIYHGIAGRARGIDIMLDAMKLLSPRFHLTLMLMIDDNYRNKLNKKIGDTQSVSLINPVPTEWIPQMVNNFDLGVFLLQPRTFNARAALPNKFFENVQGRVGQVITPTSEMQHLVNEHHLGKVSHAFDATSVAEALESLDSETAFRFKLAAEKSARALSWENFSPRIHNLIEETL